MQVDEANTKDDLLALRKSVLSDISKCIAELELAFNDHNLPKATERFIYLRYLSSIDNNIKEKGNRIGYFL